MKIAAISDTHGKLPEVKECDLLLIAGDICPNYNTGRGDVYELQAQATWLSFTFREWLDTVPAKHVVACWGNHDWVGQLSPYLVPQLRWHILTDSSVTIDGLRIWGSPWQPWFYDWAFNAPFGDDKEEFLNKKFSLIPEGTDVFVIHGPPREYGDNTMEGDEVGSRALIEAIKRVKPKLSVHGHIHWGRGQWKYPRGNADDGIIANVSVLDEAYKLVHEPMYWDI